MEVFSNPLFHAPLFELPPVSTALPDGLLAIGGDLAPQHLLMAYTNGIFPWFCEGGMPVWYFPPTRMVVLPGKQIVSKSMRAMMRNSVYQVFINKDTPLVIAGCAANRTEKGQETWIDNAFIDAYTHAAQCGLVHSVSVWEGSQLVGGLYGVAIGKIFCGESMFSTKSNTSKLAFLMLCEWLWANQFLLLDCQLPNNHLLRLGGSELDSVSFETILKRNKAFPILTPIWQMKQLK